jgi:hypothetical protein
MQASLAFLGGVVLAVVLLLATRTAKESTSGWITLAFGIMAASALAVAAVGGATSAVFLASITLGFATAIIGVGNIIRGNRHWAVWAGTALGVLGAGLWLLFVAGELFGGG